MLTYKEFLNESFVNLIGDDERKTQYADQVWDVLQRSYADIGGIQGNGFQSKEDMIKKIPFWKIDVYNGKVSAIVMYKDKNGRKAVASGTDGTQRGIKKYYEMAKAELGRSYAEKSKKSLGAAIKAHGESIEAFMIPVDEVKKIAAPDEIIPLSVFKGKLDADDAFTAKKYPQFKKYMYIREIGGKPHMKVMLGTPRKKIF